MLLAGRFVGTGMMGSVPTDQQVLGRYPVSGSAVNSRDAAADNFTERQVND